MPIIAIIGMVLEPDNALLDPAPGLSALLEKPFQPKALAAA